MNDSLATVWAIDPGPETSALVIFDVHQFKPVEMIEAVNPEIRLRLRRDIGRPNSLALIEYTPPYTMQTKGGHAYVPSQVVTTAIELGRMVEVVDQASGGGHFVLISRGDVKKHLLGRANGNDTAVGAAILDRYGGTTTKAKGTKKEPGPLYGLSGNHLRAALAVAITYLEKKGHESPWKDQAALPW